MKQKEIQQYQQTSLAACCSVPSLDSHLSKRHNFKAGVDEHEAGMNQVERRVVCPFALNIINLELDIWRDPRHVDELCPSSIGPQSSHRRLCWTQIHTNYLSNHQHCAIYRFGACFLVPGPKDTRLLPKNQLMSRALATRILITHVDGPNSGPAANVQNPLRTCTDGRNVQFPFQQ